MTDARLLARHLEWASTTPAAQDLAPEVLRILKLSIPVLAERIRVDPQPIPLSRGDVQVDLF